MFDTVILLAGRAEQVAMPPVLRGHNANLTDIRKDELDRRLKVFGGNHFGICPTINLHGIEFRAVLPGSRCVFERKP